MNKKQAINDYSASLVVNVLQVQVDLRVPLPRLLYFEAAGFIIFFILAILSFIASSPSTLSSRKVKTLSRLMLFSICVLIVTS